MLTRTMRIVWHQVEHVPIVSAVHMEGRGWTYSNTGGGIWP